VKKKKFLKLKERGRKWKIFIKKFFLVKKQAVSISRVLKQKSNITKELPPLLRTKYFIHCIERVFIKYFYKKYKFEHSRGISALRILFYSIFISQYILGGVFKKYKTLQNLIKFIKKKLQLTLRKYRKFLIKKIGIKRQAACQKKKKFFYTNKKMLKLVLKIFNSRNSFGRLFRLKKYLYLKQFRCKRFLVSKKYGYFSKNFRYSRKRIYPVLLDISKY